MTDTVGGRRRQRRGRVRDVVAKTIAEHIVADAPVDYDEVLQSAPVASGRVRLLVFLAALSISWALAILVAVALCWGGAHARPQRLAFNARRSPPAGAGLRGRPG